MLKINVEIHPFGDAITADSIHAFYIASSGIVSNKTGKVLYRVWANEDPRETKKKKDLLFHPPCHYTVWHKRSDGAIILSKKVMDKYLKRENVAKKD